MGKAKKSPNVPVRMELGPFVREYKRHKCLWDHRTNEYSKANMRQEALQIIASKFNMPVTMVKQKIHTMRSTYNQMRSKSLTMESVGKPFVPTLSWYSDASFLDDVITLRKPRESMDIKIETLANVSTSVKREQPNEEVVHLTSSSHRFVVDSYVDHNEDGGGGGGHGAAHDDDGDANEEIEYIEILKQPPATPKPQARETAESEDEFSLFSQYLASQLRAMPISVAVQLMTKLQGTVCEVRLKSMLNKSASSKR